MRESADEMEYRPISLLQTSYKIFAKALATLLHCVVPNLIGDSKKGFVHGRLMSKLVMMMLAQLATAKSDATIVAENSQVILLLYFRKAYDTMDRDFLYEALRHFCFAERYVHLITRLHTGITASFLVNGEQSRPIPVISGIR